MSGMIMDTPEIPKVDGRLAQAANHPLRVRILRLLTHRERFSPGDALGELDGGDEASLSRVSYHVSVLERFGVVELVARATRDRGASFRATDTGRLLMVDIERATGGTQD